MEIPKIFKGMKKVKEYPNFVLYKNKYYRECFTYYDLGIDTKQIRDRKINVSLHI